MPSRLRETAVSMPLKPSRSHLQRIFEKYDKDKDGRISYVELKDIINSREYEHDLPDNVVNKIRKLADRDNSGFLDLNEFVAMAHNPDMKAVFEHYITRYVNTIIPQRGPVESKVVGSGTYKEQYSCWPPAVCMILISLVEIALFCYDAAEGNTEADGTIAKLIMYNPYKRREAWRFITYMFVHKGVIHLLGNVLVQLFLGVPLEMVHRWWRVMLVYLAGVVAGSLANSLIMPTYGLVGASAGVYALVAAHVATIIMNWKEMKYPIIQLLVLLLLIAVTNAPAVYNWYWLHLDQNIGNFAHFAGVIAGLLVGIGVLRNLEKLKWERRLWWAAVVIYLCLMIGSILANIFWTKSSSCHRLRFFFAKLYKEFFSFPTVPIFYTYLHSWRRTLLYESHSAQNVFFYSSLSAVISAFTLRL